jgi:hypothetical protein
MSRAMSQRSTRRNPPRAVAEVPAPAEVPAAAAAMEPVVDGGGLFSCATQPRTFARYQKDPATGKALTCPYNAENYENWTTMPPLCDYIGIECLGKGVCLYVCVCACLCLCVCVCVCVCRSSAHDTPSASLPPTTHSLSSNARMCCRVRRQFRHVCCSVSSCVRGRHFVCLRLSLCLCLWSRQHSLCAPIRHGWPRAHARAR